MALTRAFRDWMVQQEELEDAGEATGIRKFRQKVQQENSSKCIVFHCDCYGIFYLYELHQRLKNRLAETRIPFSLVFFSTLFSRHI